MHGTPHLQPSSCMATGKPTWHAGTHHDAGATGGNDRLALAGAASAAVCQFGATVLAQAHALQAKPEQRDFSLNKCPDGLVVSYTHPRRRQARTEGGHACCNSTALPSAQAAVRAKATIAVVLRLTVRHWPLVSAALAISHLRVSQHAFTAEQP